MKLHRNKQIIMHKRNVPF